MAYDRAEDLDVFRLEFAEHPSLELRAFRPSFIGEQAVETAWPVLNDPSAGRRAQQKALTLLAESLADVLVDWDLKWLGRPVEPTLHGLVRLDTEFLLELVRAWVEQVALRPKGEDLDADPEPDIDADVDADAYPANDVVDEEWLAQLPTVPPPAPADRDPEDPSDEPADVPALPIPMPPADWPDMDADATADTTASDVADDVDSEVSVQTEAVSA